MGWSKYIDKLEELIILTREGRYSPTDGVPHFWALYPYKKEREAIRHFKTLAKRLNQKDIRTELIYITEILWETLCELLNCEEDSLEKQLIHWESNLPRSDAYNSLREALKEDLPKKISKKLKALGQNDVAIFLRIGALYPFVKSSDLFSRFETKSPCLMVIPYPHLRLGEFSIDRSKLLKSGFYRGEIILWNNGG